MPLSPASPSARIGRAEEIAALVVIAHSDRSAYTTGVAHVIDGGWSISEGNGMKLLRP